MKSKQIIVFVGVVLICVLIYKVGNYFGGGNYDNAEFYKLNVGEDTLVKIVKEFKQKNPEYILPNEIHLIDKLDSSDFLYDVYFYYKDKNQIIKTWIHPSGKNTSTFAFIAINEGLELGHWKDINEDFGFFENRKIKKEFEERILSKIESTLKNR